MQMVYRTAGGTAEPYIGLRLKAATSLSGRCARENAVLQTDDAELDDRVDKEACRKVGLRSMIVVPLVHRSKAVGVLKVTSAQANAFNAEDIATLELMAGVLSAAISDAAAASAMQEANENLTQANIRLEAMAVTDGLTELKNHRAFQERLRNEYLLALRHNTPFSVMLLDVDHFKQFNGTLGHPAGDGALKQLAALLKTIARDTDCAARYGGEEFAVILPHTDWEGAMLMAERIRQAACDTTWAHRPVTVSIGVSSLEENTKDAEQLVESADRALYCAKGLGRNRVSHAMIAPNSAP